MAKLNHMLYLSLFFTILIQLFQIALANGNWEIILPKKNDNLDKNLSVCWKYVESEGKVGRRLTITINDINDQTLNRDFIVAQYIQPEISCYTSIVLNDSIDNGTKVTMLWDSDTDELLAVGGEFSLNKISPSNSNFDFSLGVYIIIGIVIVVPSVGYFIKYKNRKSEIPKGSRSIHTLTVNRRKTYEPPIQSYRESWIELPQAITSSNEQNLKDIYEYDLLEEAEEAAKSMGLIDKVWKAKKVFIPNREDELLVRVGDELIVKEIYDDLWCYGQNKTLFEEELKKNKKLEEELEHMDLQENEKWSKFGMFPSVVLPIEFKNAKLTKATVEAIKEASEVAKPVDNNVVIKKDPNSVVITIPSKPENFVLPVNNLKRSTSLRSSLHRRATQCTNASTASIKIKIPQKSGLQDEQPPQ